MTDLITTAGDTHDPDLDVDVDPPDPPPSERQYFRSTRTGDRGYLVHRGGKEFIRLDRALEEILKPYNDATRSQWQPDGEWRPLNKVAIAIVCFEADKALMRSMGRHELGKKEWLSLRNEQRVAWMERGPTKDRFRARLWKSIQEALEPLIDR